MEEELKEGDFRPNLPKGLTVEVAQSLSKDELLKILFAGGVNESPSIGSNFGKLNISPKQPPKQPNNMIDFNVG